MTEQEWLEGDDILEFLEEKLSPRTLRLYLCACVRRIWYLLTDERSRHAVEMAERLADGLIGEPEQDAAFEAAWEVVSQIPVGSMAGEAPWAAADTLSHDKDADWADLRVDRRHWYTKYASSVLEKAANAVAFTEGDNEELISRRNSEAIAQFELLSDFVRPRRRDMQLTPSSLAWNGGLITRFAQSIYEDRDFQRFPILADALEESGCTDVEILSHCRSPGPHARGCWVVDLFLGKE